MRQLKILQFIFLFFVAFAGDLRASGVVYEDGFYKVTAREVERKIAAALKKIGAADEVKANINGKKPEDIVYSYDKNLVFLIRNVSYDEDAKSFEANVVFLSGNQIITALPFAGSYDDVLKIPVLAKRMGRGDQIFKHNIRYIYFDKDRINDNIITDPRELKGKSPKKSISAGRPIRRTEVSAPNIVTRGEKVKVRYADKVLQISTFAEALDSGAVGDVIKVRNLESKVKINARIIGPGTVSVSPVGGN